MQLGWVDYSREERETIKELLKVLGESGSLDELGVGIVKDSISDILYPGTFCITYSCKVLHSDSGAF